jgi:ABC-type lipoprotein export system ATPase subunit
MWNRDYSIRIRGLRHLYCSQNHRFLLDVEELVIPAGSVTTILGPSGSGKSTLQGRMGLLLEPGSNAFSSVEQFELVEETLHGPVCHDVAALLQRGRHGRKELENLRRRLMSYYLQSTELIPTLSIKENVSMPLRLNGISAKEANARAEDLLAYLLGCSSKEIPNKLALNSSGGEMQRIALARALANRPQILFVDEPTSSLDRENSKRVLNLMSQLAKTEETTVVMINHDETLAREYSDYIVHIQADANGWDDRIALPFRECDGFGRPMAFEVKRKGKWVTANKHFKVSHSLDVEEQNAC